MKLSIITPCSRILNLSSIYQSILDLKTNDVEWIIIYDGDKIDKRILQYEKNVKIRLFNLVRKEGDSTASMLRNIGIKNAKGDYLYFLDDDNLVHPLLYQKVCIYCKFDKVVIFNQFSINRKRRIKIFNLDKLHSGYIDTAQFVIPKGLNARWDNSIIYMDEYPYLKKVIKEIGKDNVIWVDKLYSYRNYLSRYKID